MLTSSNHVLFNGTLKNPWQTGRFCGQKFKTWWCCRFGRQKLPCCFKNKFHLSGGKNESSTGVDDEIFICSDICFHGILTCLYIFSINVLKLILNLVIPRFAKDLKEQFVQATACFEKVLNHCDWRTMLQPMHFHQTLTWICHTQLAAHGNVLLLKWWTWELLSGPQIKVSYPYKSLHKQLHCLPFWFFARNFSDFFVSVI